MRAACVALALYACGVLFATLSIWYSAQAAGEFASAELGSLTNDPNAPNDLKTAREHLERHRMWFPISLLVFIGASIWLAIKLS
jgi:hypothetical protein